MATRADVARLAGVSASTVSYALSGVRPISAETRERIESAMAELGYTPNAFARGLAGSRTGIIALHFPFTQRGLNASEFEYLHAASERARTSGSHLLLWMNPADDLAELRRLSSQGLVDGVILMEVQTEDARIAVLQETGVPFVLIGRTADTTGLSYVDSDFEEMGRLAVGHLADLGHRSILFLSQSEQLAKDGYGPIVRGQRGVEVECAARGLAVRVEHAAARIGAGRDVHERVRHDVPEVTAVVSMNEQALVGFIEAARDQGRAVPADLSVMSLGAGDSSAELVQPALTTVSPPAAEMGARAVDHLLKVVAGAGGEIQELITAPLHVRASTAAAPSAPSSSRE
ncbi:transcriptional regulator, LacI family [Quadrisphaera granulorum]|uniref:LacI family transcriptional regulator n=1 Tax=Quadrisphaera granulorum TaxID=317664 RepID=A0A315ZQK6_9ACTN|nr:LacI family DNA-binding transcriptional regulator [Quadrisphaera granulorum]PWJ47865.1 LacI family transcriptional regulator [Quadrisphaera granulorum]SZE98632.1 transcriptional regulator, LacI family [Quadrisphaera granulorum]